MAAAPGPPSEHLSFLSRAGETARLWGLFPVVRGAEARAPSLPRVGRSRLPAQDIVDLAQEPSLGFSQSTLISIVPRRGRMRIAGYWLGLVGPMGPLPTHLTEYAYYEARYAKSRPFGRFLDLLAGRFLQLFYRAWADSQPVTMVDRAQDDPFAHWLAALTGATEGAGTRAAFPASARLHYASLFASRRSAVGIEDALAHLLRQPVRLLEYQPRWQDIAREDRSQLGKCYAQLGHDAVLGARVRSASDAFRVVIQASSARDYESFLPGGGRFAIAAEALDAFAPSHLEWDIALEIDAAIAPRTRLNGRSRLGWTSWIGNDEQRPVRGDAHLRRAALSLANRG